MTTQVVKVVSRVVLDLLKKVYKFLIEDIASKILDIFWNKVDQQEVTT